MAKTIVIFKDETGVEPFTIWLNQLNDARYRRRVLTRLRRLEQGNYDDCNYLQDGIFELRLFYGPGYRIYFTEDGGTLIVLLCGEDNSSQIKNIQKATMYWIEYKNNA